MSHACYAEPQHGRDVASKTLPSRDHMTLRSPSKSCIGTPMSPQCGDLRIGVRERARAGKARPCRRGDRTADRVPNRRRAVRKNGSGAWSGHRAAQLARIEHTHPDAESVTEGGVGLSRSQYRGGRESGQPCCREHSGTRANRGSPTRGARDPTADGAPCCARSARADTERHPCANCCSDGSAFTVAVAVILALTITLAVTVADTNGFAHPENAHAHPDTDPPDAASLADADHQALVTARVASGPLPRAPAAPPLAQDAARASRLNGSAAGE
jgi:hypothetical protein